MVSHFVFSCLILRMDIGPNTFVYWPFAIRSPRSAGSYSLPISPIFLLLFWLMIYIYTWILYCYYYYLYILKLPVLHRCKYDF